VLGIALHAANIYAPGSTWLVHDSTTNVVLGWLAEFIHEFRMPGFFWLAGYFTALSLHKVGFRRTLADRLLRLGVPLLVVWIVVNRIQLGLVPLPHSASPGGTGGMPPLFHLWFLVDLILIVPSVGLVGWALKRWPQALARLGQLRALPLVLLLTLVSTTLSVLVRASGVAYVDLLGLTTLYRLSDSVVFFAVGALMRLYRPLHLRFLELPVPVQGLGLALAMALTLPMPALGPVLRELQGMARIFVAWSMVATVMLVCKRLFDRKNAVVDSLVDASYSIYLFHHVLVVALGHWLLGWNAPAMLKFGLVCATTLAVTWSAHRLVISRSRGLRLVLNGRITRAPK
jgi:glucan biosynthesis protein C